MKSETENAQPASQTPTPLPTYTTPQWATTSRMPILRDKPEQNALTNFRCQKSQ